MDKNHWDGVLSVCLSVSIPIGKLSLIGPDSAEPVPSPSGRFNSHWEVESHWTRPLRRAHPALRTVSIPIGKLSLIGHLAGSHPGRRHGSFNSHWEVESHWTRGGRHLDVRFDLGFNSHWEVESHWTWRSRW